MSREISSDFEVLKNFLGNYNLQRLLNNEDYISLISQQHKKYFAFLCCIAELSILYNDSKLLPVLSKKQLSFIMESCSDIGISIFVMTQGAYKASKMMQRSSIETFLKGFCLDQIVDIDQEKHVYNIFNKVKDLNFFKNPCNSKIIEFIHRDYKILCKDTHTATEVNMANISALNYFPEFSKTAAINVSNTLSKLVSSYISLLIIKYNNHYHKMHYRNKENIIENIPKYLRPIINKIA